MNARDLQKLMPHFDWSTYLQVRDLGGYDHFNVEEPKYYRALDKVISKYSLADWQTYLRWHFIHAQADLLSSPFVTENFNFFLKTLRGVPQQQPRWKRCVALTDEQLGDALGREVVERSLRSEEHNSELQP